MQILKSESGFNLLKDVLVPGVTAAAAKVYPATKDDNLVVIDKLSVSRKRLWKVWA